MWNVPRLHPFVGTFSPHLYTPKALRVSRGIALLFLRPRHCRWRWGVSPTPRPPLPPEKTRYPLYRRLGGPCTGGKSRPHRDSIPDRPARSQSLYRMSFRAHFTPMFFWLSGRWRSSFFSDVTLRGLVVTNATGQHTGRIFRGQAVQEE